MKSIKLKNYPKNLPPTAEVRDFALDGGKFARVIMELTKVVSENLNSNGPKIEHWMISAQCYEMTKAGNFAQAPNGFPSRSGSSTHTMPASAMNITMKIDDGWVRHSMNVDVKNPPGNVKMVMKDPTDAEVVAHGTIHHNKKLARTWMYVQGWADVIAQSKIEELERVLSSSTVHSGLGFR